MCKDCFWNYSVGLFLDSALLYVNYITCTNHQSIFFRHKASCPRTISKFRACLQNLMMVTETALLPNIKHWISFKIRKVIEISVKNLIILYVQTILIQLPNIIPNHISAVRLSPAQIKKLWIYIRNRLTESISLNMLLCSNFISLPCPVNVRQVSSRKELGKRYACSKRLSY